ncbi:MAG: ABC transporter permease [Bacteroidota bacterium]
MNKLWLIIKREYWTRVRKKTFILATLGTPLAIAIFIMVVGWIFSNNTEELRIAVKDDTGVVKVIKDSPSVKFKVMNDVDLEDLRKTYQDKDFDGILYIPEYGENLMKEDFKATYYSEQQLGIMTKEMVQNQLERKFREHKIDQSNIDRKMLDGLDTSFDIKEKSADLESSEEEKSISAELATVMGMFMGFIMYLVVFIYGSMVMRSVMEEKTSRIVEVMISSVKPFQLMMGKIVGVGGVGLTQVLIWAILIPVVVTVVGLLFPVDPSSMQEMSAAGEVDVEEMEFHINMLLEKLKDMDWIIILPLFVLFFLGGYFLYSSLFAAVGSAMGDDLGEGQTLTIPIIIPVILALYVMMAVVQNPNSSMATWSSMIPFFSPIVLPARLAFQPPAWEIALSLIILLASSVFFVWLSGRIYRVGILMYGKKVNFKEIGKWLFYKD